MMFDYYDDPGIQIRSLSYSRVRVLFGGPESPTVDRKDDQGQREADMLPYTLSLALDGHARLRSDASDSLT